MNLDSYIYHMEISGITYETKILLIASLYVS